MNGLEMPAPKSFISTSIHDDQDLNENQTPSPKRTIADKNVVTKLSQPTCKQLTTTQKPAKLVTKSDAKLSNDKFTSVAINVASLMEQFPPPVLEYIKRKKTGAR